MECILRDLVAENVDLQSRNQTKDRELAWAQQQLREKVNNEAFFVLVHEEYYLCSTNS